LLLGETNIIIVWTFNVTTITTEAATDSVVESTVCDTETIIETPTEAAKNLDYFRADIFYNYEYVDSGEMIPHALFTPSTASEYKKIPLIVWLHGSSDKNVGQINFRSSGLLKVLSDWDSMKLDGINAYVLCPQLVNGDFWSPYWCTENSRNNLEVLIDYYVENYNIDPDKIAICGHSLGAQGTLYLAQTLPEYFCAMAPLSAYNPCIPLTNTEIPTWCFVGQSSYGEDKTSVSYTFGNFKHAYGANCITSLPVSHANLPFTVFSMDEDLNNRTDLFEWFVTQMES
jgi:predicted peptidase